MVPVVTNINKYMDLSGEYVYSIAAAFSCSAYLLRNILWLRVLLVLASTVYIISGVNLGITSIIGWNAAFLVINIYHIILLVLDKVTINLPGNTVGIYHQHFSTLSTREFKKLIVTNQVITVENEEIIRESEVTDKIFIILSGYVDIVSANNAIASLGEGDMIGEMGFLTKEPASAQAIAHGKVLCAFWTHDDLDKLKLKNINLYNKFIAIIGCDLVRKLKRKNHSQYDSDTKLDFIV